MCSMSWMLPAGRGLRRVLASALLRLAGRMVAPAAAPVSAVAPEISVRRLTTSLDGAWLLWTAGCDRGSGAGAEAVAAPAAAGTGAGRPAARRLTASIISAR